LASYKWDGIKWIPYPATLVDAPLDGNLYERQSGTWGLDPIQTDAPNTGSFYSRRSLTWTADPIQSDAPNDANTYGRKGLAWSNIGTTFALTTYVNTGDANTLASAKTYADGEAVPIGGIIMFGGPSPPANFLNCDGTIYNIATYPKLAAIISNRYGGNGTTTFAVPNYNGGNFAIGGAPGGIGGSPTVSLAPTHMPSHAHNIPAHYHTASSPLHAHGDSGHAHAASQDAHNHIFTGSPGYGFGANAPPSPLVNQGTTITNTVQPNVYVAVNYANITGTAVSVTVDPHPAFATDYQGSGTAFGIYPPYLQSNFIIRYQ
jgi:microcystin-dependent protein